MGFSSIIENVVVIKESRLNHFPALVFYLKEREREEREGERERRSGRVTDHGCLLNDGVVGLLQVAVKDVAQHAGGVLVQVASPLGHPVVLAAYGHVDALLLQRQKAATR